MNNNKTLKAKKNRWQNFTSFSKIVKDLQDDL